MVEWVSCKKITSYFSSLNKWKIDFRFTGFRKPLQLKDISLMKVREKDYSYTDNKF